MARRKGPSITRAQVVEAAVGVVREEGVDALGVSRVAQVLGIKPPSIYNHVGPGDALARAVVLQANRSILKAFQEVTREVEGPRDQLVALAWETRRWALDNGGLYTLSSRLQPDNASPDFGPVFRQMIDLFARPLGRLGVADVDRIHAVRGLRAAMHGFILLEVSGQFQLEQDPDESYRWLVDVVLDGVSAPEKRG
jgi:AcrR family transcriptional regulator